jgi:hypothetical protein
MIGQSLKELPMLSYQEIDGTSYHKNTEPDVAKALETARQKNFRVHVSYGDSTTGKDWLEENGVHGYVRRSMGPIKVPLLIFNSRSLGGEALLDHCIVRIRECAGGRILYQHPQYSFGLLTIRKIIGILNLKNPISLYCDDTLHATFTSLMQLQRWLIKLGVFISAK